MKQGRASPALGAVTRVPRSSTWHSATRHSSAARALPAPGLCLAASSAQQLTWHQGECWSEGWMTGAPGSPGFESICLGEWEMGWEEKSKEAGSRKAHNKLFLHQHLRVVKGHPQLLKILLPPQPTCKAGLLFSIGPKPGRMQGHLRKGTFCQPPWAG